MHAVLAGVAFLSACRPVPTPEVEDTGVGREPPVRAVPGFHSAAEAYFSPDGGSLILNAKHGPEEPEYHVYTTTLDGGRIARLNEKGADACSYYFPDGEHVVFTSTRDNPHLPAGDYSKIDDYPRGAELYVARTDGTEVRRLTFNENYDAEVSVSPDGRWILFTRQVDGLLDLWRMRPDGTEQTRVTHTADWQEGGAFYLPDSEHVIFRAWLLDDEALSPKPMTIFTIRHDGTELRQVTHEPGLNWAPHPAPDGEHFAFVKMLPPHDFEIFLMSLVTGRQARVTWNAGFDGYPAFSPDGHTLAFTSSRGQEPGTRRVGIFLVDVGPLLASL